MTGDDLSWIVENEARLHPFPWTKGNFIDSLEAGYHARVAWIDAVPVAYAVVLYVLDEAHLLNISVNLDWQRQNVATRFLKILCQDASLNGATQMFLEVRPSNIAAWTLYDKFGFRQIGRRKNYYPAIQGGREDAIVMRYDFD